MTHTPKNSDTAPQVIRDALRRVSEASGYTEAQLCSRQRFPDVLAARYLLWWICLKQGCSSNEIADALGLDGSTIRKAYGKLRDQFGAFPRRSRGYPDKLRTISPVFTGFVLGTFSQDMVHNVGLEAGKELNECKKVVE